MKLRRIVSAAMALLLVCAMPLSAMADDWYLDNGDITISNTDGTQTVSQSGTTSNDNTPTIKQNNSGTATDKSITVKTSGDYSASFTIDGINTDGGKIDVGNSNATITVNGNNTIVTSGNDAGVHVSGGNLTITGTGTLNVEKNGEADADGAAIGSDKCENEEMSGSITIGGSVTVVADTTKGGSGDGAAIGSGEDGNMRGKITIGENATVNAKSEYGAAIGSGYYDGYPKNTMSGTITIEGNAKVSAESQKGGSAIGSGYRSDMNGSVTIQGSSQVTTTNGSFVYDSNIRTGAAIGSGAEGNMNGTIRIGSNATLEISDNTSIGAGDNGEYGEKFSIVYFEEEKPGEETSEEGTTAKTTALYRVVDAKGISTGYKSELKDGVLTISVSRDYASFIGTLAGLKKLKGWGVNTIVFQTNGATSTFDVEDLLAKTTGNFALTHDGETVTFTLDETDVSDILK